MKFFYHHLQNLVLEFQVDDPSQVKDCATFRGRLYKLYMDHGDFHEFACDALEDMNLDFFEWAESLSSRNLKTHKELNIGSGLCDRLEKIMWEDFIDYWETGEIEEVQGYTKYHDRGLVA